MYENIMTNKGTFPKIKKIHFVGIGGVGMSGIAEVLLTQGYEVSGSDTSKNQACERLNQLGAKIYFQHNQENVRHTDVVVTSSAIHEDNIEVLTAKALRIPIVPRALMLAELMRFHHGIAVAGTHGKTTTTSLISSLLAHGGLDPTFVIGGRLNSAGANAKLGAGNFFVAEADESDASFLHLNPFVAVVTNIDEDHLSTYQNDFNQLKKAFIDFIHQLPFYGLAIVCRECKHICSILPEIARSVRTYGLSPDADYFASNIVYKGTTTEFSVNRPKDFSPLNIKLNLPGEHNVLNALAAIVCASEEGVEDNLIQEGLKEFQGIGRRFQQIGNFSGSKGSALIVDDYGHHPKEVEVTLKAARNSWPKKRIVMVFQPHRYSRTARLFDDFARILSKVDVLIMLEVYSAGETEIPNADSASLCRSIRLRSNVDPILISKHNELQEVLNNIVQDGDILITQGAGNIGSIAQSLVVN
jgi:UDP-N-acetylmuramate--alanine ligase